MGGCCRQIAPGAAPASTCTAAARSALQIRGCGRASAQWVSLRALMPPWRQGPTLGRSALSYPQSSEDSSLRGSLANPPAGLELATPRPSLPCLAWSKHTTAGLELLGKRVLDLHFNYSCVKSLLFIFQSRFRNSTHCSCYFKQSLESCVTHKL